MTDVIFVGYLVSLAGSDTYTYREKTGHLPRSICPSFGDVLPEGWCLGWTQSPPPPPEKTLAAKAAAVGISDEHALAALMNQAHGDGTLIATQFCQRAETIRALLALMPAAGVRIFGVGLRPDDLRALTMVYDGWGRPGTTMTMLLAQHPAMPKGGVTLGWELLCADEWSSTQYSWLHNCIQEDAEERGYPLVEDAFLREYEHAHELAREANDGTIGAEPGLWLAWLVADYTAHF